MNNDGLSSAPEKFSEYAGSTDTIDMVQVSNLDKFHSSETLAEQESYLHEESAAPAKIAGFTDMTQVSAKVALDKFNSSESESYLHEVRSKNSGYTDMVQVSATNVALIEFQSSETLAETEYYLESLPSSPAKISGMPLTDVSHLDKFHSEPYFSHESTISAAPPVKISGYTSMAEAVAHLDKDKIPAEPDSILHECGFSTLKVNTTPVADIKPTLSAQTPAHVPPVVLQDTFTPAYCDDFPPASVTSTNYTKPVSDNATSTISFMGTESLAYVMPPGGTCGDETSLKLPILTGVHGYLEITPPDSPTNGSQLLPWLQELNI